FWVFNNSWMIEHVLNPYTGVLASVTAALFRLFGSNAAAYGQMITVEGTSVTVATGCNGAEAFSLFCAAVLALPTRFTRKLIGLGLGLVGILIVNEIRIIGLVIVAVVRPDYLFEAHNYVGQTFVIVMGIALWVYWAERYATTSDTHAR
ncbi:MAG: exosortase H, partial [candidate division Zixibacteria bacterium]|nr:exosortase H [candidate division Zixibacteria bacterium]